MIHTVFRCRSLNTKVDLYFKWHFYPQFQRSAPRKFGLFLFIAVLWYFPGGNETYQEIYQSGYSVFGSKFEHGTFLVHIYQDCYPSTALFYSLLDNSSITYHFNIWIPDYVRQHPHRTHDLHSGSQDHHTSKKFGAENHMLQLNIQCSWWWAYVNETCRNNNTLIKLSCCIKLVFQVVLCHMWCVPELSKFYCRSSRQLHPPPTGNTL